jgi:hydroxymethylbilane synthase
MLPAPGQGALAVECRSDDEPTRRACATLDDEVSRACVTAERAVLAALEAGCTAPVGVLADWAEGDDGPELLVRAVVTAPDGTGELRRSVMGSVRDPAEVGRRLAALLLEDGAAELARSGPQYAGTWAGTSTATSAATSAATTATAEAGPREPVTVSTAEQESDT